MARKFGKYVGQLENANNEVLNGQDMDDAREGPRVKQIWGILEGYDEGLAERRTRSVGA